MELVSRFQSLCRSERRRWFLLVGVVAVTHISLQLFLLPYGNALRSLIVTDKLHALKASIAIRSSAKGSNPLALNISHSNYGSTEPEIPNLGSGSKDDSKLEEYGSATNRTKLDNSIGIDVGTDESNNLDLENDEELNEERELDQVEDDDDNLMAEHSVRLQQIVMPSFEIPAANPSTEARSPLVLANASVDSRPGFSFESPALNETSPSNSTDNKNDIAKKRPSPSRPAKRKMRCEMPPRSVTTIEEMNQILRKHRRSSRAMRPRWSSKRDEEILAARLQIESASDATKDTELHAPIFRNVSMFKRSYDIMERTLKVYVYKEGRRPIFHTPILKGLYASEGWFMKLMESNRHYVVKQPRRAHLFYMPFSSRMLEYNLYVRNSHNRTNLREFMKDYTDTISAKYPYFNRTGGADHFLVACHDWAPYETRHHMEQCIKALCNADVTLGYKIGRDVSLPETYVRSARNPLRDIGGKPVSQRNVLAFYAGSMHGYLRPILLNYWKDDPDMKIFGPMPPGVASKMSYIQHMKTSRYCICPKGYEVNSPRVVESIFYECVPVIISDNFVPPFFDVLDWSAFSVIIAEKDLPNLKQILLSIPEERYVEMQLAVRKAQRHFVWHAKPQRYDLFHMTLHSIWYNRVFQMKRR